MDCPTIRIQTPCYISRSSQPVATYGGFFVPFVSGQEGFVGKPKWKLPIYSSVRRSQTNASLSSSDISGLSSISANYHCNNSVANVGRKLLRICVECCNSFALSPTEDLKRIRCIYHHHQKFTNIAKSSNFNQPMESAVPRSTFIDKSSPASSPLDDNSTIYYESLAKLSLTQNELYIQGFPTKQYDSDAVYVYMENFFKKSVNYNDNCVLLEEFRRRFEAKTSPVVFRNGYIVRKCIRCDEFFAMSPTNAYLTMDRCSYHPGRLIGLEYSCCNGRLALGCEEAARHVWTGYGEGLNGPMEGYVQTQPKHPSVPKNKYGIFGIDCEMGYTSEGFELIKVSVVNISGQVVYETLVKPQGELVDLNTKYSGVFLEDFVQTENLKSLNQVQDDLLRLIGSESLLVGHSLEGDLKALKIVHERVVDTSLLFPHASGLPYRNGLKRLTKSVLKRDIQNGINGHDSAEDAQAALDLALWRVDNKL